MMEDTPKRVRGPSHRPLPSDWFQHAPREGDMRLKARYGVGRPVILRWRAATGIYCGQPRGPRQPKKRKCISSSIIQRQKPYKLPTMSAKLSWYDEEDDVGSLHDIYRDRSYRDEF
jgi:hypothetical protein